MSNLLFGNGMVELDVAASDKIAVFSCSPVKIYKLLSFAKFPAEWALLKDLAADTEYTSAAFSIATRVRIEAGPADVLYQAGTGPVIVERRGLAGQGAPTALNATGTLTAAAILSGLVTSTSAAAVAATLDTGAIVDAAVEMDVGESFDWSVINTGPNTFTVTAAASGHTVVGSGDVATATSGRFRTRKTAADTFITYRLS